MTTVSMRPSRAHLMSAPLPQLLVELDAELVDSNVTDGVFFGEAVVSAGRVLLAMPAGQDSKVRDLAARALLGKTFGVELAPVPAPLELSVRVS